MYLYGHLAHIETQVGTVLFSLPAVIKLINEVVLWKSGCPLTPKKQQQQQQQQQH